MLDDVATALEGLVRDTLALMNDGARLDQIVAEVRVPESLLKKPYLRPTYDEPEFVVRNIWRLYGGWWDANPATLKPAREAAVASELASLAGGAIRLAERGREVAATDIRLACHLVGVRRWPRPTTPLSHGPGRGLRAAPGVGLSLMSKGIYGQAAAQSREISEQSGACRASPCSENA